MRAEVVVRRLNQRDAPQLEAYLRSDPLAYIYPLGWLLRDGVATSNPSFHFDFLGGLYQGQLQAASLRAGGVLWFLATGEPRVAQLLAQHESIQPGGFSVLVGPQSAVSAAWDVLELKGFRARLRRPQVVFAIKRDELTRISEHPVRVAQRHDLQALLVATLEMHKHETYERATAQEIEVFRRSIEFQITQQRLFLSTVGPRNELCFKVSISALCDYGAQLEGVYVPEAHRRRGFAANGMSQICDRLLDRVQVVTLYVNADNQAAIQLYERLGFREVMDFETIFIVKD